MAYCDFVVRYDKDKDTLEELTERILYSIWINRLKAKKPVRIFVSGKSGEGKSFSAIRLQELLFKMQGLDIHKHFDVVNVLNPLQYTEKLDALLTDKALKKVNIICMHEAREIIKAQDWQKFVNTAIADVHAMSRTVKRMIFMIISQGIKSISKEMRYTIDFYCTVVRYRGKRPRLTIHVLYTDERDLEKPKLRRRRLSGYIVLPNGKWRRFVPQYFEMKMPDKELTKRFEKLDFEGKSAIIKNKLERLTNEIRMDLGVTSDKIKVAVDWYLKNQSLASEIGRVRKKSFKILPQVREMLGFSKLEAAKFEKLFHEGLVKSKQIVEEEEIQE